MTRAAEKRQRKLDAIEKTLTVHQDTPLEIAIKVILPDKSDRINARNPQRFCYVPKRQEIAKMPGEVPDSIRKGFKDVFGTNDGKNYVTTKSGTIRRLDKLLAAR